MKMLRARLTNNDFRGVIMTEEQGDQVIGLLQDLLEELREARSAFDAFSGYGVDTMHDTAQAITSPLGYHIGDIHSKLDEVIVSLSSVESAIDLK